MSMLRYVVFHSGDPKDQDYIKQIRELGWDIVVYSIRDYGVHLMYKAVLRHGDFETWIYDKSIRGVLEQSLRSAQTLTSIIR